MSAFLASDMTYDCLAASLWYLYERKNSSTGFYAVVRFLGYDYNNLPKVEKAKQKIIDKIQELRCANATALVYRYGDKFEWQPEPEIDEGRFTSLEQVIKSIDCITYQCNEGIADTFKIVQDIERLGDELAHDIVSRSREYNNAQWDWRV